MTTSRQHQKAVGRAHRAHVPPTKVFPRLAVNETILKPHLASATGCANTRMWDFHDVIKFRVAAHTISEQAIRFQHPDYNPDRAQKLISSSMSQHLSTHNISSKSMHAFLSNLAHRQTDRQTDRRTRANTFLPPPLSEVIINTDRSTWPRVQELRKQTINDCNLWATGELDGRTR